MPFELSFFKHHQIHSRLTKDQSLTPQVRFGSAVGVFCLVFVLLFSQFVGWVHNLTHAQSSQTGLQSTAVSQAWSVTTLAESHFASVDISSNTTEQVNVSCKLFDALMLGACLVSVELVFFFIDVGFDIQRFSRVAANDILTLWAYLSRAPPV